MIDLYVNTDAAGGGDGSIGSPWNSLATAVTALEASGPAARGDALTVHCSGATDDTDAGAVLSQFNIATTAAHYLLIQGDNTSFGYNIASYHLVAPRRNPGILYNNVTPHLQIDRIQIQVTCGSGDTVAIKTANGNIGSAGAVTDAFQIASNCIVLDSTASTNVTAFEQRPFDGNSHGTSVMWNCLAIDARFGYQSDFVDGANFGTCANCTAARCDFGFVSNNDMLAINCLAFTDGGLGFVDGGSGWAAASNFNASDDGGLIPGANSDASAVFTFVDEPADNFALDPDDEGALGLGTTAPLGGQYDDDLQGVTRPVAWSIWALEEEAEPAVGGGNMLLLGVG